MPRTTGEKPGKASVAAPTAAGLLASRERVLLRALRELIEAPGGPQGARHVHEVRVATRRMAVAVSAFAGLAGEKEAKRSRRLLRDIRQTCSQARDADVLLQWVRGERKKSDQRNAAGIEHLQHLLTDRRRAGKAELLKAIPKLRKKCRRRLGSLLERVRDEPAQDAALPRIARETLESATDRVLAAAAEDLQDVQCLHGLRIACKRLRYAIELFQRTLGKAVARSLSSPLEMFQEHVGEFTDASMRIDLLRQAVADLRTSCQAGEDRQHGQRTDALQALSRMLRREQAALRHGQKDAIRTWREIETGGLIDDLRRNVLSLDRETPPTEFPRLSPGVAARDAGPRRTSMAVRATGNGHAPVPGTKEPSRRGKSRIAAIDIGTNSIRLIVAEAAADGTYRVLDDEKEITRLGRGLHATGRLDPATQEHSAITIARMKSIAAGYGAEELRVVATAACREASNAPQFIQLVRERADLEVEVIGPEEEALLAYRSAAGAFDLAGVPAAVVDIGGGSLEVVLSAGASRGDIRAAGLGGGVIERVHSLPLGAVRLTEQFGGPERSSGKRFRDLVRHVREKLRKAIGKPPLVPQIVVGTGGTFTTLATILAHKELGPAAAGLFSGVVQGKEIRRAELRHLLEYLRELSVKERSKIAGLPADRADIIVAGLAAIDELLGFLQANSVFVHEGGIRDGLLLSMVRGGRSDSPARDISPLRAVKRFAKSCSFEAAHAGHVTRLALRIFDQLGAQSQAIGPAHTAPGTRFDARDRLLLEAASILHDVGYLVNYASHHKHSYHLIVHADLPGLTSREVQVIANIARYHRAAEPKPTHRNFTTLNEEDRLRVRALAAILRIADGLDRTHMQQVEDVIVRVDKSDVFIDVRAESEPAVDIWGAARKARLFERVFGRAVHIEWRAGADTATSSAPATHPVPVEITPA